MAFLRRSKSKSMKLVTLTIGEWGGAIHAQLNWGKQMLLIELKS